MSEANDWKTTLNLPQTAFPMKANLPDSEPKRLSEWKSRKLYARVRETISSQGEIDAGVVLPGERQFMI